MGVQDAVHWLTTWQQTGLPGQLPPGTSTSNRPSASKGGLTSSECGCSLTVQHMSMWGYHQIRQTFNQGGPTTATPGAKSVDVLCIKMWTVTAFPSVLDYSDMIFRYASAAPVQPLCSIILPSGFITVQLYGHHHCFLHETGEWCLLLEGVMGMLLCSSSNWTQSKHSQPKSYWRTNHLKIFSVQLQLLLIPDYLTSSHSVVWYHYRFHIVVVYAFTWPNTHFRIIFPNVCNHSYSLQMCTQSKRRKHHPDPDGNYRWMCN